MKFGFRCYLPTPPNVDLVFKNEYIINKTQNLVQYKIKSISLYTHLLAIHKTLEFIIGIKYRNKFGCKRPNFGN